MSLARRRLSEPCARRRREETKQRRAVCFLLSFSDPDGFKKDQDSNVLDLQACHGSLYSAEGAPNVPWSHGKIILGCRSRSGIYPHIDTHKARIFIDTRAQYLWICLYMYSIHEPPCLHLHYVCSYTYFRLCICFYIYICIYICMYIWINMYVYGLGHIPPAFCDISKSHELKQFRVEGLGYMSLGFRLSHFPISQIMLAHLSWCLLGKWEIGKYVPVIISQFPNFPNRAGPSGLGPFWKLGNWEVCTCNHFPISQFPKSCWPIWAGVFWEIWKLGNMYLKPFPNFPIFLNHAGPSGLGPFGKLGNWEVCTCNHFPISQFSKSCWPIWAGAFLEIGKLGSMYL